MHVPISGNSAIYKPGNTGFGAAPASEPRLDTIQLRDPPPSDPNLFEALARGGPEDGKKKAADKPEPRAGLAGAQPAFRGRIRFP